MTEVIKKSLNLRTLGVGAVVAVVLLAGLFTQLRSTSENFNDADVMFAQMMMPHHEQAIEMATMALEPDRGASRDLQDIAVAILDTQTSEVDQLRNYLSEWHAPSAHSHGDEMMQGVLSDDEMRSLGEKKQQAFDRSWAKAMIQHHRGAIAMARDVLLAGKNTSLRTMAQGIITTQHREIDQLRVIARR